MLYSMLKLREMIGAEMKGNISLSPFHLYYILVYSRPASLIWSTFIFYLWISSVIQYVRTSKWAGTYSPRSKCFCVSGETLSCLLQILNQKLRLLTKEMYIELTVNTAWMPIPCESQFKIICTLSEINTAYYWHQHFSFQKVFFFFQIWKVEG